MRRSIIIGATSGIGHALALELSRRGDAVGIAGRRGALLEELRAQLPGPSASERIDLAQPEEAMQRLGTLITALEGMDLLVISSGIGVTDPDLDFAPEQETVTVNVSGFIAMATAGYRHFVQQGSGHLAGITSIAGMRGSRFNPAYGASKAFEINYLEALRNRAHHDGLPIAVTDIRPGFVDTPLTKDNQRMFWLADVETAARQIADALDRKPRVAYITHRWAIIGWLLRWLPGALLERV